MTWFTSEKPLRFEAKRWPNVGLAGLTRFVGENRVIEAKDGTVYVINSSGHPIRLDQGWWVYRAGEGGFSVCSDVIPDQDGWRETEAPQ